MLFHGNPSLIQGFNTFLPPGYRIDISSDPRDPNAIRVTTPSGTTTQSTNAAPPKSSALPYLPSRAITPYQPLDTFSQGPASTAAAATFLGGLGARNVAGEFNHAIQYLNKIKARYADDPDTYKQFLEILQTYQKEQRHIQDVSLAPQFTTLSSPPIQSQVYAQVQLLFKDALDLLAEFKDFLPEASLAFAAPGGVAGILPQPTVSPGVPAQWSDTDKDKITKKPLVSAPKKRRKGPEKDSTPVPASRLIVSRVRAVDIILHFVADTCLRQRNQSIHTSPESQIRLITPPMRYLPPRRPTPLLSLKPMSCHRLHSPT